MDTKDLKLNIKKILSEHLGVELSDINDDDDFINDLQMETVSLVDFQEKLSASGIDVSDVDFKEVETIDELVDAIEGASVEHHVEHMDEL